MRIINNKDLLVIGIDECLEYLKGFKTEMSKTKEQGKHKEHNKMEVKYKKQKALVEKHKGVKL